ncbi:MAG: lyase [Gemmatimonadaceae bacterium]
MRLSLLFLAVVAASPAVAVAHAQQAAANGSVAQYDPKEWDVPYGAATRPRDPYADTHGRVWFVGQEGNYIAYRDTRSGEFKKYEIAPGTNPHNLVVEKGMVWFTGNRNNRIVKLDPANGKLTTYMIPDESVKDPHTMTFDPKSGVAWFTAQQAGVVGRFEPNTGHFRLWKTGPDTRPYGIVLDSKGRPWFDLFGTNKIGTIDPETFVLRMHTLPSDTARPRRIAVTSDDQIYFGDYTRGFLGHLEPKSGRIEEFALPLGRAALPYAMTTDDRDVIWVAQNGHANVPATLVAFDPKTQKFVAEIPIGKPGPNTIRHMTFDKTTRQIWFGTDQGALGKIAVPPRVLVP